MTKNIPLKSLVEMMEDMQNKNNSTQCAHQSEIRRSGGPVFQIHCVYFGSAGEREKSQRRLRSRKCWSCC